MNKTKTVKNMIAIIGVLSLLMENSFLADAVKVQEESIFYTVTGEGEAVITGCSYGMEEVIIPPSIDNIPVSGVGEGAFEGRTDIKKVIVQPGVRYIAADAFAGCAGLEEIELAEGLQYIGTGAFSGDIRLEEVYIPDSVLYVGENAFGACTSLTALDFPQTACVDAYAFEGSAWQAARDEGPFRIRGSCLLEARGNEGPVLEIPYGVTETAEYGWRRRAAVSQDVEYEEIILPDTLADLGESSFYYTWIDTIDIPLGIKEIKAYTFMDTILGEIRLPQGLKSIGYEAFVRSTLTEIEFPDTLEVIEEGALLECRSLEKVTIPGSVRYIGRTAFSMCDSLSEVVFEEGLRVVYADAFCYCSSLERIQFPESLESIEGGEYGTYSAALRRVYIPQGTVNIDEKIFSYFEKYDSPIVIYGQKGSRAEEVARASGMEFVEVENGNEMP